MTPGPPPSDEVASHARQRQIDFTAAAIQLAEHAENSQTWWIALSPEDQDAVRWLWAQTKLAYLQFLNRPEGSE